jgi:hypothetical protein
MAALVRELSNQADIVKLFAEGNRAVFEFLSAHGLVMEEMLCDKCYDIETGIGEQIQMKLVDRKEKGLYWRCAARHERTIRHHSEFFTWSIDITTDGRNNCNK